MIEGIQTFKVIPVMHLIMLDLARGGRETLEDHEHPLPVGAPGLWHLTVEEFVRVLHKYTRDVHAGHSPLSGPARIFGTDFPHEPLTYLLYPSELLGAAVTVLARRVSVERLDERTALKEEFTVTLCDMDSGDVSGVNQRGSPGPREDWKLDRAGGTGDVVLGWIRGLSVIVRTMRTLFL